MTITSPRVRRDSAAGPSGIPAVPVPAAPLSGGSIHVTRGGTPEVSLVLSAHNEGPV